MSKKVAVILAGCGHLDGAEIHESVMTLLALRMEGFDVSIFAPNKEQHHVVNFLTGEATSQKRNVLEEAARIARGKIQPLDALKSTDFAAIALPGGFGAAKNLCDFAFKGKDAQVDPQVTRVLGAALKAGQPLLAVCIAPAIVGLVAAQQGMNLKLTLGAAGNDASAAMKSLGHTIVGCEAGDAVTDGDHKVVTTPAYMHEITLDQAWPGIQKAVKSLSKLVSA